MYTSLGIVACLCAVAAAVSSVAFLRTRRFLYDSVTVAAIEAGLAMLAASLASGAAAEHAVAGRWWDWSAPLTAALACGLLYIGYLILRHAVEEPTRRATFCAVFAIFAFLDIPIVTVSVVWWTARHSWSAAWRIDALGLAGLLLLACAMAAVRLRQEEARRELDSLRRTVHAF